ncbi:MAG: Flp pilus assembly protein CpaB [Halieaceae bacterium]|nr:Flp pilus assembly protein CpaB [Halieaceae bacterium]
MAEVSGPKLIIAAGISGLIAAGAVMLYLTSVESKYKKDAEPVPEQMVAVIVPRVNLAKGDPLLKEQLASRRIPVKYAPSDAILASSVDKVVNRTLLTAVKVGRPMVWHAVTSTRSKTFSDVVDIGTRALTIKIRDVDSSDGLLRPGDKIDLMGTFQLGDLGIASADANSGVDDDAVMPVLEEVEVVEAARIDKNGRRYEYREAKDSKDGIGFDFTLITMNLTPKQIARVQLGQRTGSLFAVLRNREDTSYAGYEYLGIDHLLTQDKPDPVDVVLDDDGKPIGRVIGDKIVDKDGNVVGKVVNGRAVGLNGKTMGSISKGVSEDDPIMKVATVEDVVRDADGNIVGRVVDGKVVDRAGNVIGRVVDGQPVSSDGTVMGSVDKGVALDEDGNEVDLSKSNAKQDLVFDDSGKPIGKVVGNKILDRNGKVIGKVVNGKAVSLDGKDLGTIVKNVRAGDPINDVAEVADVVRDADGRVIGRIVNGEIVDRAGNVIGKVVDGKPVSNDVVRDADGNIVGRIVDGKVVDDSGNVIGRVVDGQAVSNDGEILGSVDSGGVMGSVDKGVALDADGNEVDLSSSSASSKPARIEKVIRDSSGNVIGRVVDGKVVDDTGKIIGTVDADGNAISNSGRSLGKVEEALVNEAGMVVGEPAEVVRNDKGEIIGRVKDGKVVDADGNVIGTVDSNGKAIANDGSTLGSVEKVMLNNDGELIDGDLVDSGVSVIRDASGAIIGKLVDGKVVNQAGEIVGKLVDGQVISNNGDVLHEGVTIGTASEAAVKAASSASVQSQRRMRVIDFIPGGNAQQGITPVVKVRAQ